MRRTAAAMAAAQMCGGFAWPRVIMSVPAYFAGRGPFRNVVRRKP